MNRNAVVKIKFKKIFILYFLESLIRYIRPVV